MRTGLLIAALTGAVIATQVGLVGRFASRISPLVVSLLVHVAGLAAAATWLTVRRSWAVVGDAAATGWWWIAAGVAGWLIIAGLGASSARAGVAAALAVVVTTQLVAGLAWDAATGVASIDTRAVLGVTALALGAYLLASRV